jgi:hypothetical protein
MAKLNKWQKIAYQSYDDDGLLALGDNPEKEACKDAGDMLFSFIMAELDEDEDCDSVRTAISRMELALSRIHGVVKALYKEAFTEPLDDSKRDR